MTVFEDFSAVHKNGGDFKKIGFEWAVEFISGMEANEPDERTCMRG